MIPSFVPDTRHVAQCWSCSVPVAMVSPLLVLEPSSVVHWMVLVLLPTLFQELGCDGPHPNTKRWVPLLWALLPMSRISLQYPCNGHSNKTPSGLSNPAPHGKHEIGVFEPNRKTLDAAPLMFLVTGIAASFLLQLFLQKGPSGLS